MSIKRTLPEMVQYKVLSDRCDKTVTAYTGEMLTEAKGKNTYPDYMWYLAKSYEAGRIAGIQEERQRRHANDRGLARKLREARGERSFKATCYACNISLNNLKAYESGREAPTEQEIKRLATYYGIDASTL